MAQAGGYTPNAFHTMVHIQQQNERVDNVAIFMALVSTAKTFWPYGRQAAKAMVQQGLKFMGFAAGTISIEEVLNTVEQEEQQRLSESSPGEADQMSPVQPRGMITEFEKLTPEEVEHAGWTNFGGQQQQQQPTESQQAASSTTAAVVGQPGFVLQEVQRHEPKRTAQVDSGEQQTQTPALAATQAGKWAQQFPLDPMQTAKGDPFTLQLRAENAQLKAQLADIEKTMAMMKTPGVTRTPATHNIATPQTPKRADGNTDINFDVVDQADGDDKAINTNNTKFVRDGLLFNGAPSPSDDGSMPTPGDA